MLNLARHDRSSLGRWWWTIDRQLLIVLLILFFMGCMLVASISPVQNRGDANPYHETIKHLLIAGVSMGLMISVSFASPRTVRRLACIGLAFGLPLLLLATVAGAEYQGGQRWISVLGFSLQPSEFVKPTLAIVTAWMFAEWKRSLGFAGLIAGSALYLVTIPLLLLQKDLGQTVVISAIWWGQFFLAGMPLIFIPLILAAGGLLLFLYVQFNSHAAERIADFGTPEQYGQIWYALRAFERGGWLGVGPGEGQEKYHLPDAQSDFVFAALGEEFGLVGCLLVIGLFLFVFFRTVQHFKGQEELFPQLAAAGILIGLMAQAFINMASAAHLIPAKGMTLPMLSAGGSSLLAMGLGLGALLALTRKVAAEPRRTVHAL